MPVIAAPFGAYICDMLIPNIMYWDGQHSEKRTHSLRECGMVTGAKLIRIRKTHSDDCCFGPPPPTRSRKIHTRKTVESCGWKPLSHGVAFGHDVRRRRTEWIHINGNFLMTPRWQRCRAKHAKTNQQTKHAPLVQPCGMMTECVRKLVYFLCEGTGRGMHEESGVNCTWWVLNQLAFQDARLFDLETAPLSRCIRRARFC